MLSLSALRGILGGLIDAGQLDECQVHLYKAPITLGPEVVVGDFTEADYTGYAALIADKAGSEWDDEAGNAVLSFAGVHFQPSGTTVTNTIYGFWIEGNIAGALNNEILHMEELPEPVSLASAADSLDLVIQMRIGQPAPA